MTPRLDLFGLVVADLAASVTFYRRLGLDKERWDAFWGQRYAQLRDPDGHVVDLFAPLDT